ncbi:serine/threonine-protein kinase RIO2 [Viridothelium virens]|uniref:Serine/threonine-protein kinase RIO2 n=1 Tax=Viridothelium virens TaxID=1048519 RepID=A0A6A6HQD6_VIRVR|nr:serine/threonine-protein kinase RIO2 [Viridothelium virens]
MKLDTRAIRYLTAEDWRVLTAVEMGSRNHTLVPTHLIIQIASLRSPGSVHKSISALAKTGLIARMKNAKYDGYRLTYGGLDYLALNTLRKGQWVYSVGNQIGVGKESDIYVVANESGTNCVLKIHRLGRISFRTVKSNRDYLRNRASGSWMYMSRLAAMKEFAFMRALRDNGFRVPEPVTQNRHTVVMEFVDAFPLRQISEVPDPAGLYDELMEMILSLARVGLIHGDFNEFNILIKEEQDVQQSTLSNPGVTKLTPVLIDFPQMLSMDHSNAAFYFDRDVACIKRFFERRFGFTSDEPGPFFAEAAKEVGKGSVKRLDVEVEATGFSKKMAKELEMYMKEVGVVGDGEAPQERTGDDDADQTGEDDSDQVETSEEYETSAEHPRSKTDSDLEPLPDDLEANFDALDLKEIEIPGLEDWSRPVKAAPDLRATKKAAGWAI